MSLRGSALRTLCDGRRISADNETLVAIMRVLLSIAAALFCGLARERAAAADAAGPQPVVEVEEEVYRFEPFNNGSGPMWCFGSTCLVRAGEDLLASGSEKLKGVAPLNNTRWTLWKRGAGGWELQQADPVGRTREPCPLVGFADGRVLLSANPTLAPELQGRSAPARPEILEFLTLDRKAAPRRLLPEWQGAPSFSEHSYRSFAADGPAGEAILLQNVGYTHAEWSFLARQGKFAAKGRLEWPWGAEYDKPQPIRVCYPSVMLKDRAVYFFGVSDIVEPYGKWRDYKKKLTGREWDYDFRRLFYTWSDRITDGKFHPWIEIASRDKTAGWMMPCDLWADRQGRVHLLWVDRALDTRLRKEFFPDARQTWSLSYGQVRGGKVAERRILLEAGEGLSGEIPQWGRFQVTADGLLVIAYVDGRDAAGKAISENRILRLNPEGTVARAWRVAMRHPMARYFTASVRGGSAPSTTLDLLGSTPGGENCIRYARIRLDGLP